MNEQLLTRIRECPSLPSLPTIAIQILDLTQREGVDIAEIARIISKDPALSSKILRTVNSSFYGRSQSIGTISHALVILGLQSVKTLVLGFSLVTTLSKNKSKGFKHLTYWRHSIYAATAARIIASRLKIVQQEECFLAALMQDIGMLVLDQVLGEQYGTINEKVTTHSALCAAEQEAIGITHPEVAGILAEQWKLPPLLCIPITYHHEPQKVEDPALRKMAELVYLAGLCADVFVDENAAGPIAAVRKLFQEKHQVNEANCDAMLDEIGQRTREVAPLFEINIGTSTSYEMILKKANEALVEMTLRTQQQATTLQVQNQQLKVQATTDALTGLCNRATFDTLMAEQFAAAIRDNLPLSLVMLDVDKFKSINDKHGHPTGDQVLKFVGRVLKAVARTQDTAVRYGGEEMCLILPNTTRIKASAIAETIRRALAAKPVPAGDLRLPISASFGVATLEPPFVFKLSAQLLKAADLAVYAAKHSGRNCVRVFSLPKPQTTAA